jgi:hypothetical protein
MGDAPREARRDSCGGEGTKVSSLQLSLDEPLSPELALVCPELAERARQLLPEPGWLTPVVRLETAARIRPMQILALAVAVVLSTVTPLALLLFERSPHFH